MVFPTAAGSPSEFCSRRQNSEGIPQKGKLCDTCAREDTLTLAISPAREDRKKKGPHPAREDRRVSSMKPARKDGKRIHESSREKTRHYRTGSNTIDTMQCNEQTILDTSNANAQKGSHSQTQQMKDPGVRKWNLDPRDLNATTNHINLNTDTANQKPRHSHNGTQLTCCIPVLVCAGSLPSPLSCFLLLCQLELVLLGSRLGWVLWLAWHHQLVQHPSCWPCGLPCVAGWVCGVGQL